MINEQNYITETKNLAEFYRDKKGKFIKEYIITCHKYIRELRNLDTIEIFTDLEYERAFNQILSLVEETFRPDQFVSVCSDALVRILDDQFIIYMIGVQSQLKRPIKWKQLCELQYNFGMTEIQFKIKTGFTEDFTQYAIKNIPLTELWIILKI